MGYTIRPARSADSAAIAAIYGKEVAHGTASFELTVPDAADMESRRATLAAQGYPWLVLEEAGTILGYAYAGPYRARPAYRFVVENSVYLAQEARGRGHGRTLLLELISACTALGFRQMVAVIGDSANTGSVALHSACGFTMVGTLKNVGWKHGKWLDTVLMQLPLGAADGDPPAEASTADLIASPVKTP